MDECFVRSPAPLRACWAKRGETVQVPKMEAGGCWTVFCAMNLATGAAELRTINRWTGLEFQDFLRQIRSRWRGWRIVLFLDRGSPHTCAESLFAAQDLGIELRWLPVACPELNPVEGLWGAMKGIECLANRPEPMTAREAADAGADWLCSLSPDQILQKSGARSPNFWLRDLVQARNARK